MEQAPEVDDEWLLWQIGQVEEALQLGLQFASTQYLNKYYILKYYVKQLLDIMLDNWFVDLTDSGQKNKLYFVAANPTTVFAAKIKSSV